MKLNDLVSFIRFSLNGSPHIKTSGPINRLSLFSTNAHCRSIDRIFPCNGDASHTTHTKLCRLLNFETRTVTECDLLPPASALTEQAIKKSKFKSAPCKTPICDQCKCKVLFEANLQWEFATQNY